MNPRICVCCGEPLHEEANALSRNPNVCASCSSMADGMGQSNLLDRGDVASDPARRLEVVAETIQDGLDEEELEPVRYSVGGS